MPETRIVVGQDYLQELESILKEHDPTGEKYPTLQKQYIGLKRNMRTGEIYTKVFKECLEDGDFEPSSPVQRPNLKLD